MYTSGQNSLDMNGQFGTKRPNSRKKTSELKRLWSNKRHFFFCFRNLAVIALSAMMIWKGLTFATQTKSPILVVLSGHTIHPTRGDILFVIHVGRAPQVGDLIAFTIRDREIPIVHRIIKEHHDSSTDTVEWLTKGDDNMADDRGLYAPGQLWLHPSDVLGRVVGILPYAGLLHIVLGDYPLLKYFLWGWTSLSILTRPVIGWRDFWKYVSILLILVTTSGCA